MSTTQTHPPVDARAQRAARERGARAEQQRAMERRRHRRSQMAWAIGLVVVLGLVIAAVLSSRPSISAEERLAPTFSLPTTAGGTVTLEDYRGAPVVLYFNEGAGCGSCSAQMAEIEKHPGFGEDGIPVLPIVMSPREQMLTDLTTYGVQTPFLLDDGTVSEAYGTLGNGMHEGLPGHSFVLIDADGIQRWYGEYPSMWLAPDKLLDEIEARLDS